MGRIDHQTLSALTEEARAEFRTGSAFLSFQDIKKELEDIKKDVTPPVIIKPDVSPAPAAEPRKTG